MLNLKSLKRKKVLGAIVLILILIFLTNPKTFASNSNLFEKEEYTEEFKKWLELSEEERKNTIMPRIYEVKNSINTYKNPFLKARMAKQSLEQRFSLKDIIPENLAIRDQKQTGSCWAFATLSSLETNLAMENYKKETNQSKIYDYSERHMEYATSRIFKDGVENELGYNREVGSGGSFYLASSYLTNGTGAILEEEMPFENNEDIVDISEIQNKTVSTQVYDTVMFPDYNAQTGEARTEIMNQIKNHIQNYGSVDASIHGDSASSLGFSCYNSETGAKYCNNPLVGHKIDHEVSIIGWDDNYSIDNFSENSRPTQNGAWIVRNSWGERIEYQLSELKEEIYNLLKDEEIGANWNLVEDVENELVEQLGFTIEGNMAYMKYGDNGLIYVSYEDVNVSTSLCGIVKSTDTVNYDYIYQYDEFSPAGELTVNDSSMMICNIFDKKAEGTEYLTGVSLYAPETYTCKVYLNPNGTSKDKNNLYPVPLKAGEAETISAGYHTLEFAGPVEITADSFAVVIQIQGNGTGTTYLVECKLDEINTWDYVTIENGKCFVTNGNDLENCEWLDLSKMTEINQDLINGDSTIKAFTVTQTDEEPIILEQPQTSEEESTNLSNATCEVKKVQAYYYTDNSQQDYTLIDVEINNITRRITSDSQVEYYYYLSSDANEENIDNWVKITEEQNSNDKLQFTIDSRDVSNYNEIASEDVVYLYIKEVVKNGENESETISNAMKLETDVDIDTYVNNGKIENAQSNNPTTSNPATSNPTTSAPSDDTIATKILPNTGVRVTVIIAIILVLGIGIFVYIRYKYLSKYVK